MSTTDFVRLDVMERANQIKEKLNQVDPALGTHLEAIRTALMKNEELLHILPTEVIKTYIAGMQKYKNIKLVEDAVAKPGRRKKEESVDDF